MSRVWLGCIKSVFCRPVTGLWPEPVTGVSYQAPNSTISTTNMLYLDISLPFYTGHCIKTGPILVRQKDGTKFTAYCKINPDLATHPLYTSRFEYLEDNLRISFTRLRLSSHRLRIEISPPTHWDWTLEPYTSSLACILLQPSWKDTGWRSMYCCAR